MNIFIIIMLSYIAMLATAIVWHIYGIKFNKSKPQATGKVTVIQDAFTEKYEAKPAAASNRVIPLTDEYEYEQSKKYQNLSNR